MRAVGRSIRNTLVLVGAVSLYSTVSTVRDAKKKQLATENVDKLVLTMDINGSYEKFQRENLFDSDKKLTLYQVIEALDYAKTDDQVVGVLGIFQQTGLPLSQIDELKAALLRFNADNSKFTAAYADGLNMISVNLATAFSGILLHNQGGAFLHGLHMENIFFGSLMDHWEIPFEVIKREKYKTAMNSFTEKGYTAEQKENLLEIGQSLFDQMASNVATQIHFLPSDVTPSPEELAQAKKLIAEGPFTSAEAVEHGLVDHISDRTQIPHYVRTMAIKYPNYTGIHPEDLLDAEQTAYSAIMATEEDARWKDQSKRVGAMTIEKYYKAMRKKQKAQEKLKQRNFFDKIKGQVMGETEENNNNDDETDTATTTAPAATTATDTDTETDTKEQESKTKTSKFQEKKRKKKWKKRKEEPAKIALVHLEGTISGDVKTQWAVKGLVKAADDDKVKAIVLRVDSPGGGVVPSEQLLQAVKYAQGKHKKVVVTMGSVAASGGYLMSASADHIMALPSTITGSIGVIMGKPALKKFFKNKLHLDVDTLDIGGENGAMFSAFQQFSVADKKKLESHIDTVYNSFKQIVVDGRGLSAETVDQLAQGKVYTGADAVQNGLVDSLGGYYEAIEKAKSYLPEKDRAEAKVTHYPAQRTWRTILEEMGEGENDSSIDVSMTYPVETNTNLSVDFLVNQVDGGLGLQRQLRAAGRMLNLIAPDSSTAQTVVQEHMEVKVANNVLQSIEQVTK